MSDQVRSLVARAVALSLVAAPCLPSLAFAAEAAKKKDQDAALTEVIVTAQFVEQNLQDTPIAITAVNAAMLQSRSQVTVDQIANQAPNVTLKSAGADYGPALVGFIRGVGQTDFNPALEPGVGLYVDDVYYSTLTGSVLDLLDLDRLEVLRGPQGTLAGKNSIGGSIKLYSRKPTGEGGEFLEAGYGSLDALSVRGSGDFTLSENKLFVRIAGVSRSREGQVTRLDYGCTHPGSGVPVYTVRGGSCELGTEGGINYTAGRLSLRWLPSDAVEVNFIADATRDRSESSANILMTAGPSLFPVGIDTDNNPATGYVSGPPFLPPVQTGLDLLWNAPGNLGGCRFIAYGHNSCDAASPNNPYVNYATYTDPRVAGSGGYSASAWTPFSVPPVQTVTAKGVSTTINWKINDQLELKSISAWRKYQSSFADDADGSPLPGELLLQNLTHDQKSEELRLNGKVGHLADYTVGAFYFDQNTNEDARVDIPYVALDFMHGPDLVPATTKALFAHAIIHLGNMTDLAVGLRHTDEQKRYTYARHNPDGTDLPGVPPCPAAYNCGLVDTNPASPSYGESINGKSRLFKGTRTDYRVALSHKWTDDLMTYGQMSTGYKGGGVNPRPFNANQMIAFKPETLTAYEFGVKSQVGSTLRLNAAVFFNKYKDIQLTLNECSAIAGAGFGSPCLMPWNVGDADVRGAELEIYWYPIAGLQVDSSFSKLRFKYTRVDAGAGVTLTDISPFTPKTKWSLGTQYQLSLANGGSVTPRLDVSYQGDLYSQPDNSVTSLINHYTLLNGRVTWRSPNAGYEVALEGQNLTDKVYFTTKYDLLQAGGGYQSGQPGLPRMWMMTVRRRF